MKRTIITHGIIAGLITAVYMLITMPLFVHGTVDMKHGIWIGYAGMLIALSLVFFGVKSYRNNFREGTISFGRGFLIGLEITLIASLFYGLAWEIVYARSGDWFMEQMSSSELNKLKSDGATDAELLEAKQKADDFEVLYQNPLVRFGMTLMEIFPVGLLISLITAAILRGKKFIPSST